MLEFEDLPGVRKKSFSMYFGGGEIWFEHLDGMDEHTNLVIEKLEKDYCQFKSPSKPSLIAINLDETIVNNIIINAITQKLLNSDKRFTRVVFVGVNRAIKRKIKVAFSKKTFALNFINDFEKAKEWLVSEKF